MAWSRNYFPGKRSGSASFRHRVARAGRSVRSRGGKFSVQFREGELQWIGRRASPERIVAHRRNCGDNVGPAQRTVGGIVDAEALLQAVEALPKAQSSVTPLVAHAARRPARFSNAARRTSRSDFS